MLGFWTRLRLAALVLALLVPSLLPSLALSSVRLPNGEWRLSSTDLRVSTPRGVIAVERTWQSDDLNKSAYSWHPNPAWSDLKFELDDLDGSVKRIERSGSRYARSGDAYVFERRFLIRKTPTGWRWADPQGNWIDYTAEGQITAYGDLGGGVARFDRADGRVVAVRGADNAVALTYTYTGGQVTAITAADGRTVRYRWSGTQLLTLAEN